MNSYLMVILNSRLFILLYRAIAFENNRVLAQVKPTLLKELPIHPINYDIPEDVGKCNKMVILVERMLELHRKLSGEMNPDTSKHIRSQISITDNQIDRLVYGMYELTPEEIDTVEKAVQDNR